MKVRVIRAFKQYRVGEILNPSAMFGGHLIQQRLCEEVKDEPTTPESPKLETASVKPPESATAPRQNLPRAPLPRKIGSK